MINNNNSKNNEMHNHIVTLCLLCTCLSQSIARCVMFSGACTGLMFDSPLSDKPERPR